MKRAKTFVVCSDTAGSDKLVMMSRKDGQLDLAGRIEAKTSAWTVEALADLLEVSPKSLYKMANSGRIPVIRIAGMLRFDPAESQNHVAGHEDGSLKARQAGSTGLPDNLGSKSGSNLRG